MRYRLRTLLILMALGPLMVHTGCQQRPATISPEILKKRTLPAEVKRILDNAEQLELFSIGIPRADAPALTTDTFQTCTLLGRAQIDDNNEREELLNALYKGIQESTGPAICFEPGFGLRGTADGDTVELLICFECLQIEITFRGHKQMVSTSSSPLETFNTALRRAGAPLP
jgi:hypothetical protein